MTRKGKAVVAMSGGVDSSVAALLLKEEGYEVIGISMKLWDYAEPDRPASSKTCCAAEDIADAREVAARIGIPFYAVNYTETFKNKVVAPFVNEYVRGFTPNPCILCNMHVKFDYLFERAKALGTNVLATGHYARVERAEDGRYRLLRGKDEAKDQSYFLFNLGQDALAATRFPVGHLSKADVREIAAAHGLCTAQKGESQEICFVPNNDHADFIRKWQAAGNLDRLPAAGAFVNAAGETLGTHDGIYAYTVGQRRGLKIGGNDARQYVTKIDAAANTVMLGDHAESLASGLVATNVSWVNNAAEGPCEVKIRHRHRAVAAELRPRSDGHVAVSFSEPQRAVAPGQAAVFYRGDEVIGGGWIAETIDKTPVPA